MLAVHVNAHFCSDGFPDLSANSSVSVPVSPSTPLIVYVAVPKRFNKRRWVRRVGDGDRLSKVCCCPPGCVYNASGGIRPRRERESERERERARARERCARERGARVHNHIAGCVHKHTGTGTPFISKAAGCTTHLRGRPLILSHSRGLQ